MKLSKKKKFEDQLFLNDKNRYSFNEKCKKCKNKCKQSFRVKVVYCPNFKSKGKKNGI